MTKSKKLSNTLLVVVDPQEFFFEGNKTKGRAYGKKLVKFLKKYKGDFAFARFRNSKSSPIYKLLGFRELCTDRETLLLTELAGFENDHKIFTRSVYTVFAAKGFEQYLKRLGITKLIFCGIATESCVLTSARDAFQRGYEVTVLKDLCMSDINPLLHNSALRIIEKDVGKIK